MKQALSRSKMAKQEEWVGYLLVAPALLLFLLIGLLCLVMSVGLSFFSLSTNSILQSAKFVGLQNFEHFLLGGNPLVTEMFWRAIKHNLIIAFANLIGVIPVSLLLAFLIQRITAGAKILRTVFLIPMVANGVAVYYVWLGIFDPEGSMNRLLGAVGLSHLQMYNGWLGDPRTALFSVILTIIWSSNPSSMLLYFAGMQTIDDSLYEAADIDGAGFWQKLIFIVWPTLKPITVIVIILNLNATLQIFEQIWVLTNGGPAGSTQVVNVLLYQNSFAGSAASQSNIGVGNAMGWVMFMLTFGLSLLSMKLFKDQR